VADPRVEAYADLLLDYSLGVQPGWQVLVATTTEARPLAEALSRGLARRGVYSLRRIDFGAPFPLDLDWLETAPPDLARTLAPLEQAVLDAVDAAAFVLAPAGQPGMAGVAEHARTAFRTHVTAHRARGRKGEIPTVRCDFPCLSFAERAGLSLAEYEGVFYAACLRDWEAERRRMEPVRERLDAASELRIVGDGTDLRLSLEGRPSAIDDGHLNVPGGEVFACPVEDSVEGEIRFSFASGQVHGIRLVFRAGEVVEASADEGEDALRQALETDEGARRAGEIGVGCNDGITRHLNNVLFDEKMAGTIHLALGHGFEFLGGRNHSDLHWDLVTRPAQVWADRDRLF
jgi:aminopeptidase